MSFFSLNSPFARALNKFTQMVYLGLLWFVCSIPVVTMGAATAALYEVLLKLVKNQEGAIGPSFFRGFKANLKSATLVWLPILLALVVAGVNLFYYWMFGGGAYPVQTAVFALLFLLVLAVSGFAFPVLARFENTTAGTFHMVSVLMLRNLGWTVVIAVIQALTILVCWALLWFPVLFIMGLSGYAQAVIFNHIFDPLIQQGKITEANNSEA